MTLNKLLNFSELFSLVSRPEPILKVSSCNSPGFSLSQGFSLHPATQQIGSYGAKTQRIVQSLLMEASHILRGRLTLLSTHLYPPLTSSPTQVFSFPGYCLMIAVLCSLLGGLESRASRSRSITHGPGKICPHFCSSFIAGLSFLYDSLDFHESSIVLCFAYFYFTTLLVGSSAGHIC